MKIFISTFTIMATLACKTYALSLYLNYYQLNVDSILDAISKNLLFIHHYFHLLLNIYLNLPIDLIFTFS